MPKINDAILPGIPNVDSLETIARRETDRKREKMAELARERNRIAAEDRKALLHPDAMTFMDVVQPLFWDIR